MIVFETNLPNLGPLHRGKVRDIYDLGKHLLIIATDRISAFDVVMPDAIPDKGYVLTQISLYWFKKKENIVPHHLVTAEVSEFPSVCQKYTSILDARSMLVKKNTSFTSRMYCAWLSSWLGLEGLSKDRRNMWL
ncbi:Phosphoribosylaminoimidazole-succinocarboxamide synthase [Candidatus Methanoperedenaceae archaeon GB50]|nr:Phosphoribosylaminoimidazole-succinocarboxamide synthase [Candidatus Methanoperedenaceae archaeon GB50]